MYTICCLHLYFKKNMSKKRYFPPELLKKALTKFDKSVEKYEIGRSVKGLPIIELKIGNGNKNIFMWSQMHGNETSTTRAILKLIPWLLLKSQAEFLKTFSFYIIPQLNPDGAKLYTRYNANNIDLNRDAMSLSEPESVVLNNAINRISPYVALNLHGQRTIYGAGNSGKPATLSFLAPSPDENRSITPAREKAMRIIVDIKNGLNKELPDGIARYNDVYNPNCVGDLFTSSGIPTILFEAGHYPDDYDRTIVTNYIFKAFKLLLKSLAKKSNNNSTDEYFKIPENIENFTDLLISNVDIVYEEKVFKKQQLAVQYVEKLDIDKINFVPKFIKFDNNLPYIGHRYLDLKGNREKILFRLNEEVKHSEYNKLFSLKTNN